MTKWYFKLMGEMIGPLTSDEFRERALSGQVTAETLVTKEGTDRWIRADHVAGLFDLAPTSKPSPSPPDVAAIDDDGNYEEANLIEDNVAIFKGQNKTKETIPLPATPPPAKKEYKVLTQKDKWFSGKFDPAKLEEALNAYAEQGWILKAATTATITGFVGGNRDEMIFILER